MTDAELDSIEARARAATDGPWEVGAGYDGCGIGVYALGMEIMNVQETCPDDAVFVSAARADVLALVAEVRQLQRLLRG